MAKRKIYTRKPNHNTITIKENPKEVEINVTKFLDRKRIERLALLFEDLKNKTYKVRELQENGRVDQYSLSNLKNSLKYFLESAGLDYNISDSIIFNTDIHVLSTISFLTHTWITGSEVTFDNGNTIEVYLYEFVNQKSPSNIDRKPYMIRVEYNSKNKNIKLNYNMTLNQKQYDKTLKEHITETLKDYQEQVQETPQETT